MFTIISGRYNNFKHDPLSACNCTPPYSGENAISARSDLNPQSGKYPFTALSHRLHGGTDNKVHMIHIPYNFIYVVFFFFSFRLLVINWSKS